MISLKGSYAAPVSEGDRVLYEYLEMYRDLHQKSNQEHPEFLFAEKLLQYGTFFEPRKLPAFYTPGKPGYCFEESARLAIASPSLTYVEGYALGVIPMHHAWCVNHDNQVIDRTWAAVDGLPTEGRSYLGIKISLSELQIRLAKTGRWGYF